MPFLAIHLGIDPVAFSLGVVAVHWYGIGYVLAIAAGLLVAKPYALRRGVTEEQFGSVAIWTILAGLAGGRLYYVLQNHPSAYLAEPFRVLEVWHGGMAFFGAILAALITLGGFALVRRWSVAPMLDAAALFALVGQPIGRLGNVVNGDIIGPPTSLPWGVVYTNPHSFAPSNVIAYHPAAVYEILANVALLALLVPFRHRLQRGWFAAAYIAGYCLSQLVVFTWRVQPRVAFGLEQAQITAIVVLALECVVVTIWLARGGRPFRHPPTAPPSGPSHPSAWSMS